MKSGIDGSADLMMNMVGAMVIMLAVFMPLAQLEQLTHLDNQSDEASIPFSDQANLELAMVEIRLGKDGVTPLFSWKPQGQSEVESVATYEALKRHLQDDRPDGIRLRMERQVPSGLMQDFVIDASQLGITIFQSNRVGQ